MSKPDGIPQDVWAEASIHEMDEGLRSFGKPSAILACARAIMAERERAARLVASYPEVVPMWSRGSAPPGNGPPRRATQIELAAAIRKGTP